MTRPMFVFTVDDCVELDSDALDEQAEFSLPGKYIICPRCRGEGSHTNPAIDGHGLTSADFAEDPDFAEDYFVNRVYDIQCEKCMGEKVIIIPDELFRATPAYADAWNAYDAQKEFEQDTAIEDANDRYTRRMEGGGY